MNDLTHEQLAFERAARLALAISGPPDEAPLFAELEALIQRHEIRTADESIEVVMQLQRIIRDLADAAAHPEDAIAAAVRAVAVSQGINRHT